MENSLAFLSGAGRFVFQFHRIGLLGNEAVGLWFVAMNPLTVIFRFLTNLGIRKIQSLLYLRTEYRNLHRLCLLGAWLAALWTPTKHPVIMIRMSTDTGSKLAEHLPEKSDYRLDPNGPSIK
jgi:hypothetical protein